MYFSGQPYTINYWKQQIPDYYDILILMTAWVGGVEEEIIAEEEIWENKMHGEGKKYIHTTDTHIYGHRHY